jgi:hypothetical protein
MLMWCSVTTLQGQETVPSLSAARISAQITLGTLATPVGFFGGGLLARRVARGLGASEQTARKSAYVGGYAGTWLAAATVPALVGKDGSFAAALAGSAGGLGVSVLSVKVGNRLYDQGRNGCGPFCILLGALTISAPSLGATLAYNLSR